MAALLGGAAIAFVLASSGTSPSSAPPPTSGSTTAPTQPTTTVVTPSYKVVFKRLGSSIRDATRSVPHAATQTEQGVSSQVLALRQLGREWRFSQSRYNTLSNHTPDVPEQNYVITLLRPGVTHDLALATLLAASDVPGDAVPQAGIYWSARNARHCQGGRFYGNVWFNWYLAPCTRTTEWRVLNRALTSFRA